MPARRLTLLLALATILGVFASTASAQTTPSTPAEEDPEPEVSTRDAWDRILAFSVTGGLDTPFGIGGAAIEVTPFRYLAIYAGGGVGRDGARIAAGLRPQFPMGKAALGIMLGVTGGPLDWNSGPQDLGIHRYWEFGLFLHGGASFEYRWSSGLFGRIEMGAEALVTPIEPTVCTYSAGGECGNASEGLWTPIRGWVGLSLGYALEL